jgi:hypothetical protein
MQENIIELYNVYFQKSRVFLYPYLEIKRGNKIVPIETYVSWKNEIEYYENQLICLYEIDKTIKFQNFENTYLTGNKYFNSFHQLDNNKGIYTFSFDKSDWKHFLSGRYSLLSRKLKTKILSFYKDNPNIDNVKSYLYPEEYYQAYSELLSTSTNEKDKLSKIIMDVGELCDKPDLKKEQLILTPKTLKLQDI